MNSSFIHDALPFGLGFAYVAISPFLEDLIWRSAYISFYDAHEMAEVAPEDLAKGASWAVDLAQVVPGVLLTIAGVLLAVDHITVEAGAGAAFSAVIPFLLAAVIQKRGDIQNPGRNPHLWHYSLPQLVLAVFDLIGIIVLAV